MWDNASFTHIDVHFGKGGDNSAAKLENAAAIKRKEYRAAHGSVENSPGIRGGTGASITEGSHAV